MKKNPELSKLLSNMWNDIQRQFENNGKKLKELFPIEPITAKEIKDLRNLKDERE